MNRSELRNSIIEALRNLPDDDFVAVWNNYAEQANYQDDMIYEMSEFDYYYESYSPSEIANAIVCGSDEGRENSTFNVNRDYFYFNGYGNPVSLDYIGYFDMSDKYLCSIIDEDALADYIIEYEDALGCDDLQDVLDEAEDEEEAI